MDKEIQEYDFKEGLPSEFEVLDMAKIYGEFSSILTIPHRAAFYQIHWFQWGSPTHLIDFHPVRVQPNSLLMIPKNSVQSFDRNSDFGGKSIIFTDNFFGKTEADVQFLKGSILFNDLLSVPIIELSGSTEAYTSLLAQMEAELARSDDTFQSGILRNYLRAFLLHCEREHRKQGFREVRKGPDLDSVIRFRELLENQFKGEKLVGHYADQMHLTVRRLNKATTNVLGKSAKQMIDARVLLEARRLLAHTMESVKQIAFELGFDEPTNFIKYFRKHDGSTPIEFRERHRP